MSQKPDCQHEQFGAHVAVNRMADTGRVIADVTIRCVQCEKPFRFLGLSPGLAWDRPTCSIDGVEAHLPIEPEDTPVLFSGARFEMPPELATRKES